MAATVVWVSPAAAEDPVRSLTRANALERMLAPQPRRSQILPVSKAEILAGLPKLTADERAEEQARLDELAGAVWLDGGELSDDDKSALDAALDDYGRNPDAGSSWPDVEARIRARLRR